MGMGKEVMHIMSTVWEDCVNMLLHSSHTPPSSAVLHPCCVQLICTNTHSLFDSKDADQSLFDFERCDNL